ncbi:MAG: DHH family phosphoesterase [Candidatus Thorarchaeota archaeon]|nr:MAG: DHH family phosphoesterase [Candidatus Thorarchaeota archaeon]
MERQNVLGRTMENLLETLPESMVVLLRAAVLATKKSKKVMAFSHIDADGISALAIIVRALEHEHKEFEWKNIHQINSESIIEIKSEVERFKPDLVIFSDFGTGQFGLVENHIAVMDEVRQVIILDHHLPQDRDVEDNQASHHHKIIEINPCQHDMSGSFDISGSGVAFLFALGLSPENVELTELAIVGATGDLQDFYGKGFTGVNENIIELGEAAGFLKVTRDLTFFGINTRPLPYLLQYATDPYLPGLTGEEAACYSFFEDLGIPMKDGHDEWRTWVNLESNEKQAIIQKLIQHIFEMYNDPRIASGLIGDVIILPRRPERTEMRSAKEFSTLLNACGRNKKPDVGVKICLGDHDAIIEGRHLLQEHRRNLATALRRLEDDGYTTMDGLYLVNDPDTPDTIIGIVIGMAQGSRIVPIDKPIIGVSSNTSSDSPLVKLSGRAPKHLVKRGISLKETFVSVAYAMNEKYEKLVAEAGGHPMAAGAFIQKDYVEEFLKLSSDHLEKTLKLEEIKKKD